MRPPHVPCISPAAYATAFAPLASAIAAFASSFPSNAGAASLRVWGNGGYEQLTIEKGVLTQSAQAKGYVLGVLGGVGFADSVPGFSLLAGAGVRRTSLKMEKGPAEAELDATFGAVELGAEFSLIPLVYLQTVAGYDRAFAGTWKGTFGGSTIVTADDGFDRYDRFHLTARVLFTVVPFLAIGLEPTYVVAGKIKTELPSAEEASLSGFDIKAVASLNF